MKQEEFNKKIRDLIIEMLAEENISVCMEESHDFYTDTYHISFIYRIKENEGLLPAEENK